MDIYLISLPKDLSRREILQKQFPLSFQKFHLINAIDGRLLSAKAYFDTVFKSILHYKRILSPSETGCSLSHIKALEKFIATGQEKALILEDDVIGNDIDIDTIIETAARLDENSLFICGGQDGLDQKRYLYGIKNEKTDTYELALFSYQYIFRTCCYVVTRNAAKEILNKHKECLKLADDWNAFFRNSTIKIYFSDILSHPIDLKESHIEAEREKARSFNESFFSNLIRLWKHRFGKLHCILSGYMKVDFRNDS